MKKRLALVAGLAFLIGSAMPVLGDGIPSGFSFQTINFPGDTLLLSCWASTIRRRSPAIMGRS
jgi:hypothetical protein